VSGETLADSTKTGEIHHMKLEKYIPDRSTDAKYRDMNKNSGREWWVPGKNCIIHGKTL
jgi:hypothetical protein